MSKIQKLQIKSNFLYYPRPIKVTLIKYGLFSIKHLYIGRTDMRTRE